MRQPAFKKITAVATACSASRQRTWLAQARSGRTTGSQSPVQMPGMPALLPHAVTAAQTSVMEKKSMTMPVTSGNSPCRSRPTENSVTAAASMVACKRFAVFKYSRMRTHHNIRDATNTSLQPCVEGIAGGGAVFGSLISRAVPGEPPPQSMRRRARIPALSTSRSRFQKRKMAGPSAPVSQSRSATFHTPWLEECNPRPFVVAPSGASFFQSGSCRGVLGSSCLDRGRRP